MLRTDHHSYKDIFIGVIVGGTIGALATLIMGTDKGKKFQKDFIHKMHDLNKTKDILVAKAKKFTPHQIEKKIKRKIKSRLKGKSKRR